MLKIKKIISKAAAAATMFVYTASFLLPNAAGMTGNAKNSDFASLPKFSDTQLSMPSNVSTEFLPIEPKEMPKAVPEFKAEPVTLQKLVRQNREEKFTQDDFEYAVSDGEAVLTLYKGNSIYVTVPDELGGYPVTVIGEHAFFYRNKITDIVLPESVKVIEFRAFQNCSLLERINLPESLICIEEYAFEYCGSLKSITVPQNLVTWSAAFSDTGLTEVTIPDSYTKIPDRAFYCCSELADVKLPKSLTFIGYLAFQSCSKLKTVDLPETLEVIDTESFASTGLTEIKVPAGLTRCRYAFYSCNELISVTLSEGTEFIDAGAFARCTKLKDFSFLNGKSLVSIGESAFMGCTELTELSLPENITAIGFGAFSDSNLKEVSLTNSLTDWESAFVGCKELEKVIFPKGFTSVADGAFAGCRKLIEVNLPDSVEFIGRRAFSDTGLTEVQLPESLAVWDYAFSNCQRLEKVVFPAGFTTLAEGAFYECTAMKTVTLPESITEIGEYAFAYSGITKIELPKNIICVAASTFEGCSDLAEVKFNSEITAIDYAAFACCGKLTEIIFPESLVSIGMFAFIECKELTAVYIPDSVTYIDSMAFMDCENLSIYSNPDSYARQYAIENGIDYADWGGTVIKDSFSYCLEINKSDKPIGTLTTVKAEYEIKEQYPASGQNLIFTLSSDVAFIENSVTVDGKQAEYIRNGNTVTVMTNRQKCTVRFCVTTLTEGWHEIDGFLSFETGGNAVRESIGMINIRAFKLTVMVPDTTGQKTVPIKGVAVPLSDIKIYSDDILVGETSANKAGNWSLKVELPESDMGKYYSVHKIYAEVTAAEDVTVESEPFFLTYNATYAEVSKITVINNGQTVVLDRLNPNPVTPVYTYNPSYKSFTFKVEFTDVASEIKNVFAVTRNKRGETTRIPTVYDANANAWIGVCDFESFDVPTGISVDYECNSTVKFSDDMINRYLSEIGLLADSNFLDSAGIKFEVVTNTFNDSGYGSITSQVHFTGDGKTVTLYNRLQYFSIGDEAISVDGDDFVAVDFSNGDKCYFGIECNSGVAAMYLYNETQKTFFTCEWFKTLPQVPQTTDIKPAPSAGDLNTATGIAASALVGKAPNIAGGVITGVIGIGMNEAERSKFNDKVNKTKNCVGDNNSGLKNLSELGDMIYTGGTALGITSIIIGVGLTLAAAPVALSVGFAVAAAGMSAIMGLAGTVLNKQLDSMRKKNKCDKDPDDPLDPIIDPSGYVYEAVASNRLSDVTVTCYYKGTDGDGGEFTAIWDAENYSQANPLLTDSQGRYAWDVPIGMWQVKYEKDGYETAYSGWLSVPPPQTDVNVGLVSKSAPKVLNVSGYEDYIEIVFDKYMDTDSLTKANISLADYSGEYTVIFADAEESPDNSEKVYARTVHIVPDGIFEMDKTYGIAVDKSAESYSGVGMTENFNGDVTVTFEPKSLELAEKLVLSYGETADINISVSPLEAGANRSITAVSNSPMIVSVNNESVTDENSTARFTVNGVMAGTAEITFMLYGTQIVSKMTVTVELPNEVPQPLKKAARPTANLKSGTVAYGTELILATDTEGAAIYYTTDCTCPCADGSRKLYTGSIIITEDTVIYAAAYKYGMDFSPVLALEFTVETAQLGDINGDGAVDASDASAVLTAYAMISTGQDSGLTETQLFNADVNGDGVADATDASLILGYYAYVQTTNEEPIPFKEFFLS